MLANMVQPDFTRDLERLAVTCNDQLYFEAPTAEDVIDTSLRALRNMTKFAMSSMTTEADQGCEFWNIKSKDRFHGPWNQTLSNPILIVSNSVRPLIFPIVLNDNPCSIPYHRRIQLPP